MICGKLEMRTKKDIVMADYWRDEDFTNEEQKRLFELLRDERGEDFAACYHCCLKVLNDFAHPEKLHLAAYALRELMDKLQLNPSTRGMKSLLDELESHWGQLKNSCKDILVKKKLKGREMERVRTFLGECDNFFNVRKTSEPDRQERMQSLVKRLDPASMPMPDEHIKPRADKMMEIWKQTNRILHTATRRLPKAN